MQEVDDHPESNGREDNWRQRVSPNSIRARKFRPGEAQDDHAENGQERAKQEAESNVNDDELEAFREQHEVDDGELDESGVGRDAVSILASEKSEKPKISFRVISSYASGAHRFDIRAANQSTAREVASWVSGYPPATSALVQSLFLV